MPLLCEICQNEDALHSMVHCNCLSCASALALTAASFLGNVRTSHAAKRMPCLTIVIQCRGLLHDSAAPWAKHAMTWPCLPAAKQDLSKADSPRQWVAAIYFITMTITTVSGSPVQDSPCLGMLHCSISHTNGSSGQSNELQLPKWLGQTCRLA